MAFMPRPRRAAAFSYALAPFSIIVLLLGTPAMLIRQDGRRAEIAGMATQRR